jgi:hypothetical protein
MRKTALQLDKDAEAITYSAAQAAIAAEGLPEILEQKLLAIPLVLALLKLALHT